MKVPTRQKEIKKEKNKQRKQRNTIHKQKAKRKRASFSCLDKVNKFMISPKSNQSLSNSHHLSHPPPKFVQHLIYLSKLCPDLSKILSISTQNSSNLFISIQDSSSLSISNQNLSNFSQTLINPLKSSIKSSYLKSSYRATDLP